MFLPMVLAAVLCPTSLTLAQSVVERESLVYRLRLYDGMGYEETFLPPTEDTIYLMPDNNNAVCARLTLVYLLPQTGRYLAAFKALDEEVHGTLEILKERIVIEVLRKRDNVIYYPRGRFAGTSVLRLDEEAHVCYDKYREVWDRYYERLAEYYEARAEYMEKTNQLSAQTMDKKPVAEEEPLEVEAPEEPRPPEGPEFYVVAPSRDYIINLPVGNYGVRIKADDGTILEDSERNLVVFSCRREREVGYAVMRDSTWTLWESCSDPEKEIHTKGANTLYVRPHYENEYNELYYAKLMDPQNSGRVDRWMWLEMEPVENVALVLLKEGIEVLRSARAVFIVKRTHGKGYQIIHFGKGDSSEDAESVFQGYRLDVSTRDSGKYEIILEDLGSGDLIEESRRELIIDWPVTS